MAKKSGRKKLKTTQAKIDSAIMQLYQTGIIHSTIIHTCLFLIMALTIFSNEQTKTVKLSLSFSSASDNNAVSLEDIPEIEIEQTQQNEEIAQDTSFLDDAIDSSVEVSDIQSPEIEKETSREKDITELVSNEDLNRVIVSEEKEKVSKQLIRTTDRIEARTTHRNPFPNQQPFRNQRTLGADNVIGDTEDSTEVAKIRQRLQGAGAKTGDVQISLAWDSVDDIDLHVKFQDKFGQFSYISWMNRAGINGGMLDVDMNAHPANLAARAVENVFWPFGSSPDGDFIVGIHNFRNWSGLPSVPVTVLIKTNKGTKTIKAMAVFGQQPQQVIRFSTKDLNIDKPNPQ
jgi:hypothetical protein